MAKVQINLFSQSHENIPVYMNVVQHNQKLKMEISEKYHIQHQSPQAIIMVKGEIQATLNHQQIRNLEKVSTYLTDFPRA
mgnify:CR=1 FL=1